MVTDIEEGLFYFERSDKNTASIMYQFGSNRIWHHKNNSTSFAHAQRVFLSIILNRN